MTESPAVRRAVSGDEPLLRDLRINALTEAPEAFGSTLERELNRTPAEWRLWLSPGATFIAETSRSPIGLISGKHDADDPDVVHLLGMWVHPSHRGSGVADRLVDALIAWARAENAVRIRLDVMEGNPAAARLYERHGFTHTGVRTIRERDGRLELRMERATV